MTRYLVSDTNPQGLRLEEILKAIRKDILDRCVKIVDDHRPEAEYVMDNNMKILNLLSESIRLAEDSTQTLDKAFGPSTKDEGGLPRIGKL